MRHLLLGDWHMSDDQAFNQPQPQMFTSLFKQIYSIVYSQYTWYKHHACHAGKHDHDG